MNALIVALFAALGVCAAVPCGLLGCGGLVGPLALSGPGVLGGSISPLIAPIGRVGLGAEVITRGGGVVGVSGAGAIVKGPPTAPVIIDGPAGTIKADGLWGPTLKGVASSW